MMPDLTDRPARPVIMQFRARCFALCFGFSFLLALFASCRAPIRTVRVDPAETYRALDANALNSGELSPDSKFVLHRFDLEEEYERNPLSAIRKLHALAVEQRARVMLFALAETSYLAAQRGFTQDGYLAATVYAYHYLFGTDSIRPVNPYSRSFRVACDLYNLGLLKALRSEDGEQFQFAASRRELPVGHLDIKTSTAGFEWSDVVFEKYLPADNVRVIGLSSRRRDAGVGVPLIAVLEHKLKDPKSTLHIPRRGNVAATAFLRVEGSLADLEKNGAATLELYSALDVPSVKLADRSVPLETDLTAPLAYQLGTSRVWGLEFGAFFRGSDYENDSGIWMIQPYKPGKIPVVFVHGTASSPARWAEMFNELAADPDLRSNYQFFFFTYSTGNPVAYSASLLRDALTHMLEELDPEGKDPALRNMVLIGHSQGGILAKMQVIHSGDVFWHNVERSKLKIDKLNESDLAALRHYLVFDPLPCVKRVVFLATPQRGSFVAGGWLGQILASFISLPSKMMDKVTKDVKSPEVVQQLKGQIPTSVANMKADHPFTQAIASIDVAEGIPYHSIIAVQGEGPPDELDDGLVQYKSAHLEHAESELVVRSFHSCQDNPNTIGEVRRILLEHLRASGKSHP
jgi:hypothetical protein